MAGDDDPSAWIPRNPPLDTGRPVTSGSRDARERSPRSAVVTDYRRGSSAPGTSLLRAPRMLPAIAEHPPPRMRIARFTRGSGAGDPA
jgi:hypothetical protein